MSIQVSAPNLPKDSGEKALTKSEKYLADLVQQIPPVNPNINEVFELGKLRDRAASFLSELALPTKRDEDWRFTDISPLLGVKFQTAKTQVIGADVLDQLLVPEAVDSRLVFVNGEYKAEYSLIANLPEGMVVGNLTELPLELRQQVWDYLEKQLPSSREVFTTLNAAGMTDVAVVWVPKNRIVETPIQLLFVSVGDDSPIFIQPRCLVVAETGSSITLIEKYLSVDCGENASSHPYFVNAVTEIWLEENAEVNHIRVQQEANAAFHIGKSAIAQSRNSRYTCHAIAQGAKLSRHNLEVFQRGEATETTLNGLALVVGEQLADTHSTIALNYPYGTTRQLHKTIVDDKGHAVFNGKVFVPKAAQMTDAAQLNRNLLLSSKARVDTKPQLEITADNVKCSHGATVSQLDEEEVFYLQSRGLDKEMSRNLLVDAFALDMIDRIPVPSVRKMLSRCVACRTN